MPSTHHAREPLPAPSALTYYRSAHGELMLCAEHQRQARQGQLRVMADQLRAAGKP